MADAALDRLERDAGDEAADADGDDQRPEPGSPEARLADYLRPRDWLDP